MRKRYLTEPQHSILRCMAQNNGRADIYSGRRDAHYTPGRAVIFGQAMHCMLQNRWITNRGQNERQTYVWTDAGKLAYERGWYDASALTRVAYWQCDPPPPADAGPLTTKQHGEAGR